MMDISIMVDHCYVECHLRCVSLMLNVIMLSVVAPQNELEFPSRGGLFN